MSRVYLRCVTLNIDIYKVKAATKDKMVQLTLPLFLHRDNSLWSQACAIREFLFCFR